MYVSVSLTLCVLLGEISRKSDISFNFLAELSVYSLDLSWIRLNYIIRFLFSFNSFIANEFAIKFIFVRKLCLKFRTHSNSDVVLMPFNVSLFFFRLTFALNNILILAVRVSNDWSEEVFDCDPVLSSSFPFSLYKNCVHLSLFFSNYSVVLWMRSQIRHAIKTISIFDGQPLDRQIWIKFIKAFSQLTSPNIHIVNILKHVCLKPFCRSALICHLRHYLISN